MPLTGTYLRALDDKRRLAVPKRIKDDFGEPDMEHLYIAPGTDRSLVLYAPKAFQELSQRLQQQSDQKNYLRLFFSSSERVDLDSQGRIRIPDRLAEHAGLDREVYLIGVQDHAELWEKRIWESFVAQWSPSFDKLAHEAFRPH